MGHEQREKAEAVRKARLSILSRTADAMAKLLCELGPCHAVTIAFTVPDEEENRLGTHAFSGFFDPNMGSAHYAALSDVMNKYHVDLQKKLDEEALKAQKEAQEAQELAESPPGVVVEHEAPKEDHEPS